MNIFEKKTKWLPLSMYNSNGKDHIILIRKWESGMLYFKVKKITPDVGLSYISEKLGLSINEQFNKIINQ